jgi:hypothetical protein
MRQTPSPDSLVLRSGTSFAALLAGSLAVSGAGCVAEDTVPGPPYAVVVIDRGNDPAAADAFTFSLQRRTLDSVTNFARLESAAFRVRQGGTLSVTETIDGDRLTNGHFAGGSDPDLRYVVEDGAAVPRDDATLFMFSAAYQFGYVLPRLVDASAPDVGTVFVTRGPMEIFFGPRIVLTQANGVELADTAHTNAFFNPRGWQFGVERTSDLERVPLATDPRVIAHELGHAVFQIVFFGGQDGGCNPALALANATDPFFPGRLDSEIVVSGLNEGFADWMSFASTGGTNPLESANLPVVAGVDLNTVRILTEDNFRWSQILKMEGVPADLGCIDMYCMGTLFARSLVATYLGQGHAIADEDARHALSRDVVSALRGTAERMKTIGLPPPTDDVARCRERPFASTALDPPIIGAYLQAFLAGFPAEQAPRLCDELASRFEDGFPVAFRQGCTP